MSEAFILSACRTPFGKYGGALKDVRPDDMAALVMKEAVRRAGIDAAEIDDVMFGCANQAGEDNRNVARMGALLAGFPERVPAVTLNRLCGSSMDAVIQAARAIRAGEADIIVAGGVESMTRAPYSLPKNVTGGAVFGNIPAYDTALGWRYPNQKMEAMFPLESMGETAENVAEQWKVSREDQDAFAFESHQRAVAAQERGDYAEELVPVEVVTRKSSTLVTQDEQPRADTTIEKLATLKPAFRKGGSVTAGNSSSLNDGASAVVVVSEAVIKRLGIEPLGRYVSSGVEGLSPRCMGLGPIYATRKALTRAKLDVKDIDLFELNEAFAAQSLPVIRDLGLDAAKVNPNGGAIAIGHPLGASGGRLVGTLLYEMRRKKLRRGVATMCIGVGQGIAAVFERD
ncbi:MAG: thiolase family protein [Bacteroidota bacterium]|nr:thiolase family protein [Bacteroidota bacterium]MDP4233134.1 thiolase family protein [Bacteroidota bacterium]MDP4241721.1 thiolase family protein [Bacteroidota bacterium]MDP4287379.1 thiolase family protein [Bacteroidota bacterium]